MTPGMVEPRALWKLSKDARTVHCIALPHSLGFELLIAAGDGRLLTGTVHRDPMELAKVSHTWRDEFEKAGWASWV